MKTKNLGVCRATPFSMKKMRKNAVFKHFFPCKLPKEPVNRKILRLFAAKFYKSDRLLVPCPEYVLTKVRCTKDISRRHGVHKEHGERLMIHFVSFFLCAFVSFVRGNIGKISEEEISWRREVHSLFGAGLLIAMLCVSLASCISTKTQEKRLAPPYTTSEFRLDEIKQYLSENPAKAIDTIGIYRESYKRLEEGSAAELDDLENEALEKLKELQLKAIEEERWDDAASFSRSLASMGVRVENTGMEPDFILAGAKKKLADGNMLGAFLAAVQAHELRPLAFDDAMLFLEYAVKVRQRRAAAYFYAAAESAGKAANTGKAASAGSAGKTGNAANAKKTIPQGMAEYAQGRDNVSDMVKGVATVVVDRGMKIEKGWGFPDRVLGSAFFVDASGYLITNYHVISSEVDTKYKGYSRRRN